MCNKSEFSVAAIHRALCSSLCLLLASERLASAVYLCGCPSCEGRAQHGSLKRHHGSSSRGSDLVFAACKKDNRSGGAVVGRAVGMPQEGMLHFMVRES